MRLCYIISRIKEANTSVSVRQKTSFNKHLRKEFFVYIFDKAHRLKISLYVNKAQISFIYSSMR